LLSGFEGFVKLTAVERVRGWQIRELHDVRDISMFRDDTACMSHGVFELAEPV
jgi:hypothetical protein